ncbi:hypothetical protein [Geoalkalibacter sp.]|uniref:hypothetical protein n=1 Tax=Geoalkalibacter sp. TaxID=3041440 RepID=UPI00272E383D|nr:hypothetical protein [Geoalkalibacter sp.]
MNISRLIRALALPLLCSTPLPALGAIGVQVEGSDVLGQILWALWGLVLLAQLAPALFLGLALARVVARWMGTRILSTGGPP